jgi:hypothetical protein
LVFDKKFINKYASRFRITQNGNTVYIRGIIQPFHHSYKSYFSNKRLPAGVFDGKHYLFISTPDLSDVLIRGMILRGDDKDYRVKSVETYRVKNNDLYARAVLTACAENEGDVYE